MAPSSLAVTRPQPSDNSLRWRWVSSTSLLCYGQIAKHSKEQILPWVDNIASRMVYYFSCGPHVRPHLPVERRGGQGSRGNSLKRYSQGIPSVPGPQPTQGLLPTHLGPVLWLQVAGIGLCQACTVRLTQGEGSPVLSFLTWQRSCMYM